MKQKCIDWDGAHVPQGWQQLLTIVRSQIPLFLTLSILTIPNIVAPCQYFSIDFLPRRSSLSPSLLK